MATSINSTLSITDAAATPRARSINSLPSRARKGDSGTSMVVFESEDAAQAASERVPSMVPDVVTIQDIEVCEVVAHT